MMKLPILLLSVITTATAVGAEWTKITFPVELLQPDLHFIAQYYSNVRLVNAYVDWPGSITYRIDLSEQLPSKDLYLKVYGNFELKKLGFIVTSYQGLYYKDNRFYIKRKKGAMKPILSDTSVTYIPRRIKKPQHAYLSIKYFSLEELKQAIEPFYLKNKEYVDGFLRQDPVSLLAIVPNTNGHFVEYTFLGADKPTTLADGKLQVLLGTEKKNKLILTNTTEAYRLVFDQEQYTVTIPETFDIHSKPLENVFGVRMARKGFLAVVDPESTQESVRMLNSDDLSVHYSKETQHSMPVHELLEKVKTVEPRYIPLLFQSGHSFKSTPKSALFQVHGQVLVKKANFKDSYIDHSCPFTIKYAEKGRKFLYGNRLVDKIYTDERKMWVEGEGPVPSPEKTVSIMY